MPSSTSCSTAASATKATCSTWRAVGNVVEKSGAWYNYKSTRLGQGRENAKQFLANNKDLADEIRAQRAIKQGPCGRQAFA